MNFKEKAVNFARSKLNKRDNGDYKDEVLNQNDSYDLEGELEYSSKQNKLTLIKEKVKNVGITTYVMSKVSDFNANTVEVSNRLNDKISNIRSDITDNLTDDLCEQVVLESRETLQLYLLEAKHRLVDLNEDIKLIDKDLRRAKRELDKAKRDRENKRKQIKKARYNDENDRKYDLRLVEDDYNFYLSEYNRFDEDSRKLSEERQNVRGFVQKYQVYAFYIEDDFLDIYTNQIIDSDELQDDINNMKMHDLKKSAVISVIVFFISMFLFEGFIARLIMSGVAFWISHKIKTAKLNDICSDLHETVRNAIRSRVLTYYENDLELRKFYVNEYKSDSELRQAYIKLIEKRKKGSSNSEPKSVLDKKPLHSPTTVDDSEAREIRSLDKNSLIDHAIADFFRDHMTKHDFRGLDFIDHFDYVTKIYFKLKGFSASELNKNLLETFEDYLSEVFDKAVHVIKAVRTKHQNDFYIELTIQHRELDGVIDYDELKQHKKYEPKISLGIELDGSNFVWNCAKEPVFLLSAKMGSGKTEVVKNIIYQANRQGFITVLSDFKSQHETDYDCDEIGIEVNQSYEELNRNIALLEQEMNERAKIAGTTNIVEYNETTRNKIPPLLFIIDEFPQIQAIAGKEQLIETLQSIVLNAMRWRSYMIYIVLVVQDAKGDSFGDRVLGTTIRDLAGLKLVRGTKSISFMKTDSDEEKTMLRFEKTIKDQKRNEGMMIAISENNPPAIIKSAYRKNQDYSQMNYQDYEIGNPARYLGLDTNSKIVEVNEYETVETQRTVKRSSSRRKTMQIDSKGKVSASDLAKQFTDKEKASVSGSIKIDM